MLDYGFNQVELSGGTAYVPDSDMANILSGIKSIGASRVRILVAWDLVETSLNVYSWPNLDRAVNACVSYGLIPHPVISVGPTLFGTPNMPGYASPTTYGQFCAALATRYGASGTNQIHAWEIWNEPNNIAFFPNGTHPEIYAQYLQAAYTSIKAVDPSCTVVSGGTMPCGTGWPSTSPIDWYTAIYQSGANKYFDALGYHWYGGDFAFKQWPPTSPNDLFWPMLQQVRTLMVNNGDSAKKMWVTEFGVPSGASGYSYTVAQQWMQTYVTSLLTLNYMGPFFIYNYHNTASDNGQSNQNNAYGVVTWTYDKKQPLWDYCATISNQGSGGTTPPAPSAPTGLTAPAVTATTASLTWNANNPAVPTYNVYNFGTKIGSTASTNFLATQLLPGSAQSFYVTAVDAYNQESAASNTVTPTTSAPGGQQSFYQYNFTGTGSTSPTVFTQLGVGFSVSGGVATHNHASSDGTYYVVAPYTSDQQSTDHYAEITLAAAAPSYGEVSAMAVVRTKPDGSQWVAAVSYWGGVDSVRILTYYNGTVTIQQGFQARALAVGEKLRCTVVGNAYTITMTDTNGVMTNLGTWTDLSNVYPGQANRRTGLGWQFIRSKSTNYDAPGITGWWKGVDVGPVVVSGGVGDAWQLAVTPDDDWPDVFADGLWQAEV